MDSINLIVPAAADRPEYMTELPFAFRTDAQGVMLCVKSVLGLEYKLFRNIFFVVLATHDERFGLSAMLEAQFKTYRLDNARIVVLESPTSSQPETVYKTIVSQSLTGSIFIKDADCSFNCCVKKGNYVAVHPLENLEWVNPRHKSYVSVDEMYYVTNIIEKKIVSHMFCAGGYGFEDVEDFVKYYEQLKGFEGLYLSHIIYAMLLDKKIFRPLMTENYMDYEKE